MKTLHLSALDGAKDRLHFFKASLLEEGSFDAAVDGCETVFHTASPFYHNVKDPKVCIMTRDENNICPMLLDLSCTPSFSYYKAYYSNCINRLIIQISFNMN